MLKEAELQKLYQYARSLTNGNEQAYDLVHQAIIKVQQYEPDNVIAYCKRMIKNAYFDMHKYNDRFVETEITELVREEDLESLLHSKLSVKTILSKVSAEDREILYLWAVEGKTFKEISEDIGIKQGTLLSRMSRLKNEIKSMESIDDII